MTPQMALLWEESLATFLFVTLILGGGGAWMIGRSTALTWSGWGIMAFYAFLLMVAVRFIHFSLFGGTFFLPVSGFGTALYYGVIDYVILVAIAAAGRSYVRSRQMARQYGVLSKSEKG